tara:strand:- start:655 stop:1641 length:987 start_codon:yes stop_codon:yes gene_type:complete
LGGWGLCKKDLTEISPSGEPRTASKKGEKIKEGGVKNKITINPNVQVESQQIDEIDNLGGKTAVTAIVGSGLGLMGSAYKGISNFIKNRRQKTQQQNDLINKIRNEEEIKMSRKDYKKIHKDFKSDDPKKPRTTKYVQGKGTVSMPVKFTDEYQPEKSEKIDELSKKTLANYTRKSATSLAKHSMEFGSKPNKKDSKKLEKRHSGIMKAASKLANESLLDQVTNAYVDEATRMKKETGYDVGGTKKPTGPKAKDAALDAIKAKYKGQIMRSGSKQEKKVKGAKPSGGGKFKMMADKKKETATAAKKAGYKNTQDYVNVKARTDGGLGT